MKRECGGEVPFKMERLKREGGRRFIQEGWIEEKAEYPFKEDEWKRGDGVSIQSE